MFVYTWCYIKICSEEIHNDMTEKIEGMLYLNC